MLNFLSQVLANVTGFALGFILILFFSFLVTTMGEVRHKRWLRLCHKCKNRKNTYEDRQRIIGFWCHIHGNYLIEKGCLGQ